MPIRLKFSPAAGAFAIYTVPTVDSTDDTPLTDPFNRLDRVILHPSLRYPGVVATITGTLSMPAFTSATITNLRQTHVLGAHGQSGRPMIIGKILGAGVGGVDVPWRGSYCIAPLVSYAGIGSYRRLWISRWLSLGVQGGNVVCYQDSNGSSATMGAHSISYEILIFNRDLTASLPSTGASRMRISGSAFVFETPRGTISSEQRLLKLGSGSGSFALSGGRTTTIKYNHTVGSSIVKETTFKQSMGTAVLDLNVDYTVRSATATLLPAAAVNPRMEQVKA